MHTLGKVLMGLAIFGALAAMVMMSRAIAVRNTWTKANDELRKANDANEEKIAKKETELAKLRDELKVTQLNWGDWIDGFNVNQANAAAISAPIGMRDGIISGQNRQPPGEDPVLQAFRPSADGNGYVWVGPLRVQGVTDTDTNFVPTWTVSPEEADPWNANNQRWRVWQRVPVASITRFTDLQENTLEGLERLGEKGRYLARQQQLLADANDQNRIRQEELVGPPNAPAKPENLLGMEYSHGLLATIAAEEEARNATQAEIDRLRRELKAAYAQLQGTVDENLELIKELPPATKPVSATD